MDKMNSKRRLTASASSPLRAGDIERISASSASGISASARVIPQPAQSQTPSGPGRRRQGPRQAGPPVQCQSTPMEYEPLRTWPCPERPRLAARWRRRRTHASCSSTSIYVQPRASQAHSGCSSTQPAACVASKPRGGGHRGLEIACARLLDSSFKQAALRTETHGHRRLLRPPCAQPCDVAAVAARTQPVPHA